MKKLLHYFVALSLLLSSSVNAQTISGGGGGGGGSSTISSPVGSKVPSSSVSVALAAPNVSTAYYFGTPSSTQYAVGDMVSNSATAASVVPMSWAMAPSNGTPVYLTSATVLYRDMTATPTGNTNTSTSVTGVSSLSNVALGESITSSAGDIPQGTYITATAVATITLSQAATASNSSATLSIGQGVATTAAWFRIHYFSSPPYINVGDNTALSGVMGFGSYCGSMDVQLLVQGTDWTSGVAYPINGPYVACQPASGSSTIYAIMEAKATFTPVSDGQFMVQPISQ